MYCKVFSSYVWAETDQKTDGCCNKWSVLKRVGMSQATHTVPGSTQVFCRIAMKTANTGESQLRNGKVIKCLPKAF